MTTNKLDSRLDVSMKSTSNQIYPMNRRTKILQQTRESGFLQKLELQRSRIRPRAYFKWAVGLLLVLATVYAAISLFGWTGAQEKGSQPTISPDLSLSRSTNNFLSERKQNSSEPLYSIASPRQMEKVVPLMDGGSTPFFQGDVIEYVNHTVRPGENLWSIARRYNRQIYTIVSANQSLLKRYSTLPADIDLRIPNHDGILTRLKPGQTMWDLMQSYKVDYREILSFNEISSAKYLKSGQELFIPGATPLNPYRYRPSTISKEMFSWPVAPDKQRITSRYGKRMHPVLKRKIFHRGIDIGGGRGSAVFATSAGEVTYANKWGQYGITVVIDHKNGYRTLYAHLLREVVAEGQYVEQGQPVAFIGQTGMATGHNLHFEIRKNGKTKNPLNFLPD